jgi:hypothetical protein
VPLDRARLLTLPYSSHLRRPPATFRTATSSQKPAARGVVNRKSISHPKGGVLAGFQSDLLRQHDIARDKMALWQKTQSANRLANIVELLDIPLVAVVDPVDLPTIAPDNFEISVLLIAR